MPQLPFQKNLIQSVMDGSKPGTVRQLRKKYPIKAGDTLYLFTGMRSPKCKKHGSHVCVKVYPIKVNWKTKTIELDGVTLVPIIRHWFATTDIQGSSYNSEMLEGYVKIYEWHKREITHKVSGLKSHNPAKNRTDRTEVLITNYDSPCGTLNLFDKH